MSSRKKMPLLNKSESEVAQPLHNPHKLGAVVEKDGVHFRVWAPNASKVSVVGDFNDWKGDAHVMTRGDDGKWSLKIPEVKAGEPYKYDITNGDRTFRKNDPYAKRIDRKRRTSLVFQSEYSWKTSEYHLPAFNELIIYELHVGTFASKDGKRSGTFADVRGHLPYLKKLGVNAIEIMPPCEFPTERSWGYNVTNPFAVEENYGGPDELKKLVDEAHAIGIGIILDIAYNHFGPDELDLWQFDGWNENNLGGIYFFNDWRAWTPWGENRPDYGRGEVRQFIRDNAMMWLEEYRADGLRLDSTIFMRDVHGNPYCKDTEIPEAWSLFQWLNEEVTKHFPGRIMIAEDLACNPWVTEEMGAGGAGFHAQWDAAFVHPIRAAVQCVKDEDRNLDDVAAAIRNVYNCDPCARVIYSESHDEVANGRARVPTEVDPQNAASYHAKKRSVIAAGFVMTSPGIPMIFEGQEFLENGWFRDDVQVDWNKADAFRGIRMLYRDLIHLRLNRSGKTRGLSGSGLNVYHFNRQDKVLAYHRFHQGGAGDDVIIVVNLGHQAFDHYEIGSPREGEWKVRLNSDWKGYSEEFGNDANPVEATSTQSEGLDGLPHRMAFSLPPYSLLILSQEG